MNNIIAIANHKGGVGKTTTVVSLGSILSSMGKRVLLVDLDAQMNLTTSLYRGDYERSIFEALRDRKELPIIKIKENLSIVPSSLDLAGVELALATTYGREYILKNLLSEIERDYDYILLDCPPSLGLITVNAFVASQEVIIPLMGEALPFKGLDMLLKIVSLVQDNLNRVLSISGIILTRWKGSKLNKIVEEALKEKYGEKVYSSKIRENVSIAESPLAVQDIVSYAPGSNGAKDYSLLVEEFIRRHS